MKTSVKQGVKTTKNGAWRQQETILRMKKYLCLLAVCLPLALPAFAQTADEVEALLETGAVTYAQAARFALDAANITIDSAQGGQPANLWSTNLWFEYAAQQGWLPKNVSADDKARLDGAALLVMRSFDIKGGIMYSILKNPRYAYRELVYQNVIHGRIDPAMDVSGDALLYIINKIIAQREDEQ